MTRPWATRPASRRGSPPRYFQKWSSDGEYLKTLKLKALWRLADGLGRRCGEEFARFLDPPPCVSDEGRERFVRAFGLRTEHEGESLDNLLKIFHLARAYPDLALFVQANPAFCCPSLVTEAMTRDIQRLTGVPVVSITYDGTGRYQNEVIVPYVKYAAARPHTAPHAAPARPARRALPTGRTRLLNQSLD